MKKVINKVHTLTFMIEVSTEQAQTFILTQQGLLTNSPTTIIDVAKKIHNIQIDTISVVARSHDLILFNRKPDYLEGGIWNLLEEKKLFEFWSHGICLIPIEEYPFYAWKMDYRKVNPDNWWKKWLPKNEEVITEVYNYVKKNGPTCSADFKRQEKKKSEGWWDWKKEKMALEILFDQGKLLIAYRKNFQKYYDIKDRVLPPGISSEPLPKDELADYLVKTVCSSLGIASYEEFRHYIGRDVFKYLWKNNKNSVNKFLQNKIKEDYLIEVNIKEQETKYFTLKQFENELKNTNNVNAQNNSVKFLTPFDNVIRDRELPLRLWNFDYKIECYTPAPQRIFGYFTLPILDGHKFIGRTDLKAHRKESILEIKSLHFENWYDPTVDSYQRLSTAFIHFAKFHDCSEIQINKEVPKKIRDAITIKFPT